VIQLKSANIRKLEYRSARSTTALAIHFAVDGETFHGSCNDVSESGVRASLNRPVAIGSLGSLTLHYRDGAITRRTRVACVQGLTVGLSFLPDELPGAAAAIALVPKPPNAR
jgi:hypothetical protein